MALPGPDASMSRESWELQVQVRIVTESLWNQVFGHLVVVQPHVSFVQVKPPLYRHVVTLAQYVFGQARALTSASASD